MSEYTFDAARLPRMEAELDGYAAPYWSGLATGRLLLPFCEAGHYFWVPRPFCPRHPESDVGYRPGTGQGTVYSFTIVHRGEGAYAAAAPYALAYVELDEGPRVMAHLVDWHPGELVVGARVGLRHTGSGHGDAITTLRFAPIEHPSRQL
ncbi:hypothetical protein FPZ12_007195 [Amycolatopsis acidicola]|uniref:Uncharacterized protein n=1 Tax=Amycolatopsis acidicola TaxID=2596893 RepID=A0A5N0VG59_9PSEU|nr:OB-fold domain-containing protein [Amycolatopsis acidicola]KAA9164373.1 hypothetical protein FPZ12_007195 [Amycolatopsis acidicola]